MVAAAAALVRGIRPGITPAEFLTLLRSTAVDIGDSGFDEMTGAGRIDLARLVRAAGANSRYGDSLSYADTNYAIITSGGRQGLPALVTAAQNSWAGYFQRHYANRGVIQFYWKPDSIQTSDTRFVLTQKGNTAHNSGALDLIYRSDGKLEYRLQDSGALVSTTALNADQWYHVALSYGSAGMRLYVNGESEASAGVPGGPPLTDTLFLGAPFALGGAQSARGRFSALAFADTQSSIFPSALKVAIESQKTSATEVSTVKVKWKAWQTETSAILINIYADTDANGFNGILLASSLANDQSESASIITLTTGQPYFIYVVATDSTTLANPAPERAFAYATSTITPYAETEAVHVSISSALTPSPLSRAGQDTAILAVTLSAGATDIISNVAIRLIGNLPAADVDTVSWYRDANMNSQFENGSDTFLANLVYAGSGDTWQKSALSVSLASSGDSFIFVIRLKDTANVNDTFQPQMPRNGIVLLVAGSGPNAAATQGGIWTIFVPAHVPVAWYINDTSTIGDSFTSAPGNSANTGISPASPRRYLNDIESALISGDTIFVDAGIYFEPDTFRIDTNLIWVIGKDSISSIIDFGNSSEAAARAIRVSGRNRITIRDLSVVRGYNGVWWSDVDSSTLERIRSDTHGGAGILIDSGSTWNRLSRTSTSNSVVGIRLLYSDSNTLENNSSSSNSNYGFDITNSNGETLSGNIASSNASGFILVGSSNVTLMNCIATGNPSHGYFLGSATNNVLKNNVSSSNSSYGFTLSSSSGNTLMNNASSNSTTAYYLSSSSSNRYYQNTADSCGSWAVSVDGSSASDIFSRNVFRSNSSQSESVILNATNQSFSFERNWWGTTDSIVIKRMIGGSGRDKIVHTPFRLGLVDTTVGADTIAPIPPSITLIDTLQAMIRLSFSAPTQNEDGFSGSAAVIEFRVYRSTDSTTSNWGVPIGTASSSDTSYSDTSVMAGIRYYYRLTARDGASLTNESFYSDTATSVTTRRAGDFAGGSTIDREDAAIAASRYRIAGSYDVQFDIGRNGQDGIINEEDLLEMGRLYGQ